MKKLDFNFLEEDTLEEEVIEIEAEPKELTEEEEYEKVVKNLDKAVDKLWLAIPLVKNGKVYVKIRELSNCDEEFFIKWFKYIYPVAKTYKKIDLEYYKSKLNKEKAVTQLITFMNSLKMKCNSI